MLYRDLATLAIDGVFCEATWMTEGRFADGITSIYLIKKKSGVWTLAGFVGAKVSMPPANSASNKTTEHMSQLAHINFNYLPDSSFLSQSPPKHVYNTSTFVVTASERLKWLALGKLMKMSSHRTVYLDRTQAKSRWWKSEKEYFCPFVGQPQTQASAAGREWCGLNAGGPNGSLESDFQYHHRHSCVLAAIGYVKSFPTVGQHGTWVRALLIV